MFLQCNPCSTCKELHIKMLLYKQFEGMLHSLKCPEGHKSSILEHGQSIVPTCDDPYFAGLVVAGSVGQDECGAAQRATA